MNDGSNDVIKSLIETLQKHSMLLSAMSEGVNSAMHVALNSRHKCRECEKTATWTNVEHYVCDRHMAHMVSLAPDIFNDGWEEIIDSDHIRKIEDFLSLREQLGLRSTVH